MFRCPVVVEIRIVAIDVDVGVRIVWVWLFSGVGVFVGLNRRMEDVRKSRGFVGVRSADGSEALRGVMV